MGFHDAWKAGEWRANWPQAHSWLLHPHSGNGVAWIQWGMISKLRRVKHVDEMHIFHTLILFWYLYD